MKTDSDTLWKMAREIAQKQKQAAELTASEAGIIAWDELESDWYDWLCEKLLPEPDEE